MTGLTFGSLCSGIEAASEAWNPLGWTCAYVSEIEPFPCAYLAQRHGASRPKYLPPGFKGKRVLDRLAWGSRIPNFGDLTQIKAEELPRVDIIGAGFPCQDFSIAGLRASLSGSRGSISISGVRLLLELAELGSVRGAVLEQVPDVLNTTDNAWGNILGALVGADDALEGLEHGGKWPRAGMVAGPRARVAWRVLDAQHFGLAQRRERVWAVVDFGDGPDPAAVLFERKGLSGHPAPGRREGEDVAGTLAGGAQKRGGYSTDDFPVVPAGPQQRPAALAFGGNNCSGPIDVATARTASHTASGRMDFESETFITETVAYSIMPQNSGKDYKAREVDVAQPIMAGGPVGGNQGGGYIVEASVLRGHSDYGPGLPCLRASGGDCGDGSEALVTEAIAFSCKDYGGDAGPLAPTMRAMGHAASHANAGGQVAVAFSLRGREGGAQAEVEEGDLSPSLRAAEGGSTRPFVAHSLRGEGFDASEDGTGRGTPIVPCNAQVRRITVVEAERLQGFPDNATLIDWHSANRRDGDLAETIAYLRGHGFSDTEAAALAETPDGPRYKAIGNSWPVNVAHWIGERISSHLQAGRAVA